MAELENNTTEVEASTDADNNEEESPEEETERLLTRL